VTASIEQAEGRQPRPPVGERVARVLRVPRGGHIGQKLASACDPGSTLLDIGCGPGSPARLYAPDLHLIGVDADEGTLSTARSGGTHDTFVQADLRVDAERISRLLEQQNVQLVLLRHVIEHVPKRIGFDLLELAETVTRRFVLVETPNDFLPQGPEFGVEFQRHESGWFQHDFVGLGYSVIGTAGTRYLRGYAGKPRIPCRGGATLDFVAARMLWIDRFPKHAFELTAWKDVRGAHARLG